MKRFYKDVTVVAEDGGFRVALDGRGIRTVGGRQQIVPSRALAEAMAAEWADQGEEIDSTRFILRDMADFALDVVAPERARTIGELLPYAETDTLCYRAEPDEPLAARQRAVWEPLLSAMETRIGVSFHRVSGVMHRPQPPEAIERIAGELEGLDAFALAALRNTASLAASLTLGLAAIAPGADVEALWNAANLEEDWQAELWGKDAEAQDRRDKRFAAFRAATRFAELARA
ncbi:ATP12 family chaperone protein [Novosphingobium sp. EMRT-2]|uniref:ATP12 family chaperone protein n=1 Tax=Novosphingobium sp. EMRT-2 TaxID=2571749 RepID=UPI0010BCFA19|nr:ATP12 family protein [Novosphingobium sp. EMRT-2]QCI93467.1 molecular chaperone [Novosphingobium sp. EMRT-2]